MKVYYAHCIAIYNTPQEQRDVALLKALGFEVVNPSEPWVDEALASIPKEERMYWFEHFADECDAIAFRGLPMSHIIPAGVAKEINWFMARNKPVIELPWGLTTRVISVDQTREYLREIGKR